MNPKIQITNLYKLDDNQLKLIEKFIEEIIKFNKHTNIVGKSTLNDFWKRHVLDSLQICKHIKNKKKSILDMGTGAGIPGVFLSIAGYSNVSLIDSNSKKIKFIQKVSHKLNINPKIHLKRIENLKNIKFDFLISRALAKLSKLFFYSHYFTKKGTVLIFLKGKTVKQEIEQAKTEWVFFYKTYKSLSDESGRVLVIKNLRKRND